MVMSTVSDNVNCVGKAFVASVSNIIRRSSYKITFLGFKLCLCEDHVETDHMIPPDRLSQIVWNFVWNQICDADTADDIATLFMDALRFPSPISADQ